MNLILEIVDENAPGEELEQAAKSLRRELDEIDEVSIIRQPAEAQTGAKGDLTMLGTIAISLVSSAVPALVTMLGRWIQDRNRCTVRITRPDGTSLEIPHQLDRVQIERLVSSLIPG
jgi:Effector Associated Constant Component 1